MTRVANSITHPAHVIKAIKGLLTKCTCSKPRCEKTFWKFSSCANVSGSFSKNNFFKNASFLAMSSEHLRNFWLISSCKSSASEKAWSPPKKTLTICRTFVYAFLPLAVLFALEVRTMLLDFVQRFVQVIQRVWDAIYCLCIFFCFFNEPAHYMTQIGSAERTSAGLLLHFINGFHPLK